MNLTRGDYKPYIKANTELQYLSTHSNHPKCVLKSIPKSVEQRLSQISSNENCFVEQKREYEQALSKAGHEVVLEYKETAQNNDNFNSGTSRKRKKRKGRKCIWFNPPHSDTVSSDIGRLFLNAVEKHFSGDKFLKKLFKIHN